jgi:hypothetical protein
MPSLFFVAFLVIASLQGTFGAPCAQGLSSCFLKINTEMGEPNYPMDNHNLGTPSSVVPPSAANPDYGKSAPISASPASNSSGSVSSSDIEAYLSAHNAARARHGAAALTWSNSLSSVAQGWANGCKFKHSGGKYGGMYLPLAMTVVF